MKLRPVLVGSVFFIHGAVAADTPCQVGMVVRAGALNYDAKILEFDAVKGLYKVQFVTGFKGDIEWNPPTGLKTCTAPAVAPVAQNWFGGVWQLFKGGGGPMPGTVSPAHGM